MPPRSNRSRPGSMVDSTASQSGSVFTRLRARRWVPVEVTGGVSRGPTIPFAPSVEAFQRGAEAIEMASRREPKTTARPTRRKVQVKSALSVEGRAGTKRKTASRLKSNSKSKRKSKPESTTARPTRIKAASRTPAVLRRTASPPPAGKRRASASASRKRPRSKR